MTNIYDFDVDIDVADRQRVLEVFDHVCAGIGDKDGMRKHNTGIYLQNIPHNPLTNISDIDHKTAAQQGYLKIDFLNNSIYADVNDSSHLAKLMNTEPLWELLTHPEVVSQLAHVSNYVSLLQQYQPRSVEQLAMLLAVIRPAKRHLIGRSWEQLAQDIWKKPTDDSYYYKKSHAVAYACSVVVQLNLLCEKNI
jgi:hypothetical protein